jgi:hypothetical protein
VSVIDIVQIIEELDSVVGSSTRVPGLRGRVMVDVDRLMQVAAELRDSIPSDMQEAKEILKQKDSIINQVQLEARRVKEAAMQEAEGIKTAAREDQLAKIDETEIVKEARTKGDDINQQALQDGQEIVQDAQRRAYRIVEEAEASAASRREGADQYAREMLFDLEERLSSQLGQVRGGIDALGVEMEATTAVR